MTAENFETFDQAVYDKLRSTLSQEKVARFAQMLQTELEDQFDNSCGDPAGLAQRAHRLAPSSGMLGLKAFSQSCRALDQAWSRGEDVSAAIGIIERERVQALAVLAALQ